MPAHDGSFVVEWLIIFYASVVAENQALWFIENLMIFADIRRDSF